MKVEEEGRGGGGGGRREGAPYSSSVSQSIKVCIGYPSGSQP